MPNYAVVDLGSNTIRLVVYEVKDDRRKTYSSKDFKSLINDKVMAGLSAFVTADGTFTDDGVRRAASVLKGHAKRARYFDCKRIDVFATAVLRNAANSAEAVAAIERESGLTIDLLSAADEAHLGFAGATCDRTIERGTLVDIGGGSTELTRVEDGRDFDNVSLGQGSLSSFAHVVRAILPTGDEMDAIVAALRSGSPRCPSPTRTAPTRCSASAAACARQRRCTRSHRRDEPSENDDERGDSCDTGQVPQRPRRVRAPRAQGVGGAHPHARAGVRDFLGPLRRVRAERLDICKYGVREGYLVERVLR